MAGRDTRPPQDRCNAGRRPPVSGRLRHWARRALVWATVTALIIAAVFESGLAEHWMRGALVSRLEQATGARVEMRGFRFHFWNLHLEIDDLTLHGLEAA